jgi:hypothetical protein
MSSVERVVTKKRLDERDQPWRYWMTRPPAERIAAVESLRSEHHGWTHGTEPRLPRVLAVVRHP